MIYLLQDSVGKSHCYIAMRFSLNKCYVLRNGSRHDIWYSENTNRQFAVPRHKTEIPIGTLNNILKDAGVKQ